MHNNGIYDGSYVNKGARNPIFDEEINVMEDASEVKGIKSMLERDFLFNDDVDELVLGD